MTIRAKPSRSAVRFAAPVFLAAAVAGHAGTAQATAIASASAEATLAITGISCEPAPCDIGSLFFTLDGNYVFDSDAFFFGNGTASSAGSVSPEVDSGTGTPGTPAAGEIGTNTASATASADADGLGDAFWQTDMVVLLDNESTVFTYHVDFLLTYANLAASASIDDPASEDAYSEGSIDLDVYDEQGSSIFALSVFEVADVLFGDDSDTDPASPFAFTVTLAPGASRDVVMLVDAGAHADAFDVPEPGALALAGLGLLGFGLARRRRP